MFVLDCCFGKRWLSTGRLWDHVKALLSEVTIEGKYRVDSQSAHDLKAHAVNKAEVSLTRREESADTGLMTRFIDPLDVHDGQYIFLKCSGRLNAQASLRQGEGLDEYIVAANKLRFSIHQIGPRLSRLVVILIVGAEDGQKGGRVDKDPHEP
jgi:hypothetical protein